MCGEGDTVGTSSQGSRNSRSPCQPGLSRFKLELPIESFTKINFEKAEKLFGWCVFKIVVFFSVKIGLAYLRLFKMSIPWILCFKIRLVFRLLTMPLTRSRLKVE